MTRTPFDTTPPADLPGTPLEVWAGVEATENRVGNRSFEQLERTGHLDRIEDLELFADLGIRAIRYPVLWERIAPNGLERADWSWPDARLERLRELGIRPIVGLVHHGSGPKHTSLVDPAFPEHFAEYAAAVAERYPWIEDYTPINEPLTTARFSGLYGHWHPHGRDDETFARILVQQYRGIILAMRAIRNINPAARLIQTEDPGRVHSTPALAYQADFENERRWLTFDLLSGQLTEERPLWQWLLASGIAQNELEWFVNNPCPPDMLGVDYYLSSERFLDERLDLYPGEPIGTNGIHTYVDVLAARVLSESIGRMEPLLTEVWDRYHTPIGMTEVHNGGTRDEQLRWIHDVWHGAIRARDQGIDVRALTIWALLGSFDWPTLVTQADGVYEPGVFDIRSPQPRPTAIAHMTRALATIGTYYHPALDVPGWWRRPDRFIYKHTIRSPATSPAGDDLTRIADTPQHILILDNDPYLAQHLADACLERRGHHLPFTTATGSNIFELEQHIVGCRAWAIVLASRKLGTRAFSPEFTDAVVAIGARLNLPVVVFASDDVFDGRSDRPYVESDSVSPDTEPGRIQVEAERRLLATHSKTLIVRTGPVFGSTCEDGISVRIPESETYAPEDIVSPTFAPDLASVVLDLLMDQEHGIWHVANTGPVSWQQFQEAVHGRYVPTTIAGAGPGNRRETSGSPRMRAITSDRGWFLADWRDTADLHEYQHEAPADFSQSLASDD